MNNKSEITYLFGAGASYYSMPLVENFHSRFQLFISTVHNSISGGHNQFLIDCKLFEDNLVHHLSFDTFFKKLFHKNDQKSQKFKAILMIFFIYEHIVDFDKISQFNSPSQYSSSYGIKKSNVDPRYDALVAGLLQPVRGGFNLMVKSNFLTWNYDTNLLSAIKNFKVSDGNLKDFFTVFETSINQFTIQDDLSVIHLNGRVFHPKYTSDKIIDIMDMKVILNALVIDYLKPDGSIWDFSNELKFSWETLSESNSEVRKGSHIEFAINAVLRSDIIVVIGYSFPLYNRIIDSMLFNQKTLGGKVIYVQDPHANEICSVLKSDFGLLVGNTMSYTNGSQKTVKVEPIENCRSFFVPSQVFSN